MERTLSKNEAKIILDLEFPMFEVRALETLEMIAEKARAAFQRTKVRDLYGLHRFATKPLDGEPFRALVVLKLWQVRDPFVLDALFERPAAASTTGPPAHASNRHRVEPKRGARAPAS